MHMPLVLPAAGHGASQAQARIICKRKQLRLAPSVLPVGGPWLGADSSVLPAARLAARPSAPGVPGRVLWARASVPPGVRGGLLDSAPERTLAMPVAWLRTEAWPPVSSSA